MPLRYSIQPASPFALDFQVHRALSDLDLGTKTFLQMTFKNSKFGFLPHISLYGVHLSLLLFVIRKLGMKHSILIAFTLTLFCDGLLSVNILQAILESVLFNLSAHPFNYRQQNVLNSLIFPRCFNQFKISFSIDSPSATVRNQCTELRFPVVCLLSNWIGSLVLGAIQLLYFPFISWHE